MSRSVLRVVGAVAAAAAVCPLIASPADASASLPESLANRCVTVSSLADGPVYLKATALGGKFMLYDRAGRLVSAARGGHTARIAGAGPRAIWAINSARGSLRSRFVIRSTATHQLLDAGHPVVTLRPAAHCKPFPEAQVGATGNPFAGAIRAGKVFGFVDAHLHITANFRAGGLVISGQPFDEFGIPTALGEDAKVHGADGGLDYTGNLLRSATPVGTHDTHGWPTFAGWPTYNTQTHQQTYYVWLQRAWEAGERLVVAQTAEDAPLCRLEPRRDESCNETSTIKAEIRNLKGLQDYVDAQNGGPGRGWFRLVYSPAQARRVIATGKLAVIIGIESSDLFGCSEIAGKPQCARADIDRGLREYKRLGVRGMFIAHWVNNAFGGAALEGGAKGIFINILNRLGTGSYFTTGPCPGAGQGVTVTTLPTAFLTFLAGFFPAASAIAQMGMPSYPPGLQCNTEGLTALGRYLIGRLIANHMLIEVDHLSERARDEVLTIAAQAHYPLISSHNGTGGEWTPAELTRLLALGGFAAVTPDQAPALAAKILAMSRVGFRGVGIGTDTGGYASLPGPPTTGLLRYPFKSYNGRVTFTRERTGTRTFDLNRDGVAQYGLFADLLADMQRGPQGARAMSLLFRSAEAYLETWQRVFSHRSR